ncbi:MAG: hypothetical protein ABIK15_07665 [Pseudomonadota bacterium]
MNKNLTIKLAIVMASLLLVFSGGVFGKSLGTFEGTIQGANCVVHETTCPINNQDPHVALENDFVLLTPDGEYYFLPNINRSLKIKYVNKDIRIKGEAKGHSIVVNDLSIKSGSDFQSVWNWSEITKKMNRN